MLPIFSEFCLFMAIFRQKSLREVPIGGFKLGTQALEHPSRPLKSYTLKGTRPEAGYPKIKSCVYTLHEVGFTYPGRIFENTGIFCRFVADL